MILKRFLFTLPFFIAAGTILLLSSQTDVPDLNSVFVGFDKVLHLVLYFIYGLTIQFMVIGNFPESSKKKQIIISLAIGVIFGVIDEYYQSFQPGRIPDIVDWAADSIGILISLLFFGLIKRRMQNLLT
ncbi:MAG: VanZ family protein [Candidatus Kapabacteria bacterium]|nr:VanZ family protein [Candidatus Kapabacteria bacterium]